NQVDYICYLPFDSKATSKRFIELLKPDVALFIKYEFWYYYLKELKRNKIPTFSVSAIFRPEQQFFKKSAHLFREMLSYFDQLFVQNKPSKELLNLHGFNNVTVSGDTRFDRVKEICSNPRKIEIAYQFKGNEKVLVIGSSWPEDIELLLPIINNPEIKLKFIIAPHEVEKAKIKKICDGIKSDFQLYSNADIETVQHNKVLIIDNIGMLSSLYQYGEIAYIGGAFGEGLHNILEAATFGKPIIFGRGKDNLKYQEAIDLLLLGVAFEISSTNEIELVLEDLLNNKEALQKASKVSEDYVNSKTGATNVVMNHLSKYLS
ncbi:MAG: 3-deoxy-D-manno-octulosonic acid transferase, partial [Cyclobacteriaceae bacterium]|nr:3-deoxy-D-manno-octulosonic acid transferase [Cyclobacteriaceae bacterium]